MARPLFTYSDPIKTLRELTREKSRYEIIGLTTRNFKLPASGGRRRRRHEGGHLAFVSSFSGLLGRLGQAEFSAFCFRMLIELSRCGGSWRRTFIANSEITIWIAAIQLSAAAAAMQWGGSGGPFESVFSPILGGSRLARKRKCARGFKQMKPIGWPPWPHRIVLI